MENNSFLNVNIKFIRSKNKLNQTELAQILDKKTSVISAYEKGETTPPLDVILELSKTFGIPINVLIEHDLTKSEEYVDIKKKDFKNLKEVENEQPKDIYYNNLSSEEYICQVIAFEQFRIEEVRDLINLIAEKNNYKKNRIFSTYDKTFELHKLNQLTERIGNKNIEEMPILFLETYQEAINKCLIAIYSDLFNIVNFQYFIEND